MPILRTGESEAKERDEDLGDRPMDGQEIFLILAYLKVQ